MTDQDSTSPSPRAMEETRYGSSRSSSIPGKVIVIGVALVLVVSGLSMWNLWRHESASDVSISSAGFDRPNDSLLNFTVDVTRDQASRGAYCIVTALDYDKNEVGRREFVIPAGGEGTERFTVPIPTRARAVAGKEYGCSTEIPSYLDNTDDVRTGGK
ncbi:DUF4307 domain-containing protein [Corynebacterium kroppenstedtii]|uniref:DUF4307 domain-containing protein n=1 Tax=Corynebacterium sp. PCR 32 TaxID=3351342 RepID=UPI0030A31005